MKRLGVIAVSGMLSVWVLGWPSAWGRSDTGTAAIATRSEGPDSPAERSHSHLPGPSKRMPFRTVVIEIEPRAPEASWVEIGPFLQASIRHQLSVSSGLTSVDHADVSGCRKERERPRATEGAPAFAPVIVTGFYEVRRGGIDMLWLELRYLQSGRELGAFRGGGPALDLARLSRVIACHLHRTLATGVACEIEDPYAAAQRLAGQAETLPMIEAEAALGVAMALTPTDENLALAFLNLSRREPLLVPDDRVPGCTEWMARRRIEVLQRWISHWSSREALEISTDRAYALLILPRLASPRNFPEPDQKKFAREHVVPVLQQALEWLRQPHEVVYAKLVAWSLTEPSLWPDVETMRGHGSEARAILSRLPLIRSGTMYFPILEHFFQLPDTWIDRLSKTIPAGEAAPPEPAGPDSRAVLRSWSGMPMGPEKITSYGPLQQRLTPEDRNRALAELRDLSLKELELEARKASILALLSFWENERGRHRYIAHRWIEEMTPEEWGDPDILLAIYGHFTAPERAHDMALIEFLRWMPVPEPEPEKAGWVRRFWNRLLRNRRKPEPAPWDDWDPHLAPAGSLQRRVLAALLVKLGRTDVADLIMEGPPDSHVDHYLFPILASTSFYPVQPYLAATAARRIEEVGPEGRRHRPSIEDLYRLAGTPDARAALAPFAQSDHTALSLAVCCLRGMEGDEPSLSLLETRLISADSADMLENAHGLKNVIRSLRATALQKPARAPDLHRRIGNLAEALGRAYSNNPEKARSELYWFSMFVVHDLQSFGIFPSVRDVLLEPALTRRIYAEHFDPLPLVAQALVADARHRGDLDAMLREREKATLDPDASMGPRLLLLHLRRLVGHPDPLGPFRDDLSAFLNDSTCPTPLVRQAWAQDPVAVLDAMPLEALLRHLPILAMELDPDLKARVQRKLDAEGPPGIRAVFRFAQHIPVGPLPDTWDFQPSFFRNLAVVSEWEGAHPLRHSWASELLSAGRSNWSGPFYYLRFFLAHGARLTLRSPATRRMLASSDDPVARLLWAKARIHSEGYTEEVVALLDRTFSEEGLAPTGEMIAWRNEVARIADAVSGRIPKPDLGRWAIERFMDEQLILLMAAIESGHTDVAWQLYQLLGAPWVNQIPWYRKYAALHLAWLAARVEQWEEAHRLALIAFRNAERREVAEYAKMLVELFADRPRELRAYVRILDLRPWPMRPAYAEALTAFAESAKHPDLKALAAFQAGRLAASFGNLPEARRLWALSRDSGGVHARYARLCLENEVGENPRVKVSSSWYAGRPAESRIRTIDDMLGVRSNRSGGLVHLQQVLWLDPYGIPVFSVPHLFLGNGDSHGLNIWKASTAWLHGEWTLISTHEEGSEVHHRTVVWPARETVSSAGPSGRDARRRRP